MLCDSFFPFSLSLVIAQILSEKRPIGWTAHVLCSLSVIHLLPCFHWTLTKTQTKSTAGPCHADAVNAAGIPCAGFISVRSAIAAFLPLPIPSPGLLEISRCLDITQCLISISGKTWRASCVQVSAAAALVSQPT